ncbi:MAG: HAD family phosphatase [Bombilactobacillus mellifer]|nr:HAD family phosphatase [Bombilactobacillus mellifer]
MTKAFIFDMDGVLVNSETMYFNRRMAYFNANKIQPDSTDINDYLGSGTDHVWEVLVHDPQRRAKLRRECEEFEAREPINFAPYLNDNVENFLKLLKSQNRTIALASAGGLANIQKMLDDCQIGSYFDFVLSGEEVKNNKPAPDIYLHALKKIKVDHRDCIVIEDSKFGIQAAKTAGIKTWALKPRDYRVDQKEADRIFNNFREMMQAVN